MTQVNSMRTSFARTRAPSFSNVSGRALLLLAGLCVMSACLQLVFYTGSIASDDLIYLDVATASERPTGATVHTYARVVFWQLLRASTAIFGRSEAALVAVSMSAGAVLIMLVWGFGRRHLPNNQGWPAAVALAVSPMFILYGTICTSDLPAGLFAMAGVACCAGPLLERRSSCRRALFWSVTGGWLIGMGFSLKETALLAGPGLGLFVLVFRFRCGWAWYRLAAAGAGAVLFIAVEAAVLWKLTGDPLFHFHVVSEATRVWNQPPAPGEMFAHLTDYVRWLADPNGPYGWWGLACLASMVASFGGRDAIRLIGCVTIVPLIYLSAGSVDLFDYYPVYHQPRYLLALFPFFAILMGDAYLRLGDKGLPVRVAAVVFVLLIAAQSVRFSDRNAGRFYSALTYNAGRKLFDPAGQPWIHDASFVASANTAYRVRLLAERAGIDAIALIEHPPTSVEAWIERYSGSYVLISREDRAAMKQESGILSGSAGQTLRTFPVVAEFPADTSRLQRIGATWGWCEPALDHSVRLEVRRISVPAAG